jgi:hypothetical protein
VRIWLGLLVSPLLALSDQSVAYALSGWACAHQQPYATHAAHAVFLAAVLASTFLAWGLWRDTLASAGTGDPVAGRHFLAGLATASGALSALVIAAMWYPTWILSPCYN